MNKTNKNEETPLFLAIHQGFAELVGKMMHCRELNAMLEDKEKRTPLYIAIDFDQLEAFKKILETVPRGLGAPRNRRRLLCHAAEKSSEVEVFSQLLTLAKVTSPEDEIDTADKDQLPFKTLLEKQTDSPLHSIAQSSSRSSCTLRTFCPASSLKYHGCVHR